MSEPSAIRRARPFFVLALFAATWLVGRAFGLDRLLDSAAIREMVTGAGALGVLLFLGIFTVGQLLQVPGMVFVAASVYVYGPGWGGALGFLGALVAVSVSFVVVRAVGGRALEDVERPFLRRMLSRLEAAPIRVVALLRVVFWMAPFLNYALAMTGLRFRDYLLGSCMGLVVPVGGAAILLGILLR